MQQQRHSKESKILRRIYKRKMKKRKKLKERETLVYFMAIAESLDLMMRILQCAQN